MIKVKLKYLMMKIKRFKIEKCNGLNLALYINGPEMRRFSVG